MKSLLEQRADRAGRAEGGEMGERIRRYDWTSTPLGPIEAWPPGLGNAVDLMLASPLPTVLTWGERATQLFNDPFLPILAGLLGPRQARALGQDFEDCWRGAFPGTGLPLHEPAAAVVDDGQRLFLSRDRQPNDAPLQGRLPEPLQGWLQGPFEERFFTHAVTPISGERGQTSGHLHQLIDVTTAAAAARRLRLLGDLTRATADAATLDQCLTRAADALAHGEADLPFLLFYVLDDSGTEARLVAGTKLPPGSPGQPLRQAVAITGPSGAWPLGAALAARRPFAVADVQARFAGLTAGPYPEPITSAFVLPLGEAARAVVVAGASQRARLDDTYVAFFGLLGATLADAAARAASADVQRQREATLATLDRSPAPPVSTIAGPRPRVLLLADGNDDMRSYLAQLLGRLYQVRAVTDGEAALQEARSSPPDVIVVDVALPGRDGFQLLKALRAVEATGMIPIILLSGRAGEDAALQALDAGAADYLVKPFSGKALLARVRSSIALATLRKESARQLAEATKELETFSYSVSHDLRTPLRAIDGFSRALLAEHSGQLDDQGRRYLERIRAGTQRMAELIDELLNLSRITRTALRREPVDLSAVARKVLAELAARQPERNVVVTVADGLVAEADARLITALFENLLDNAWKFSSKVAQARIEVTCEATDRPEAGRPGAGVAFVVRDNGAGFDMDYAKKLFEPFQRLHSAAGFPGIGVGLAAVHRIVTRHGGRIWAQAAPDQGAAFYFTLGEPA